MPDKSKRVELAVQDVLNAGILTPDLGGTATSAQLTNSILDRLVA